MKWYKHTKKKYAGNDVHIEYFPESELEAREAPEYRNYKKPVEVNESDVPSETIAKYAENKTKGVKAEAPKIAAKPKK